MTPDKPILKQEAYRILSATFGFAPGTIRFWSHQVIKSSQKYYFSKVEFSLLEEYGNIKRDAKCKPPEGKINAHDLASELGKAIGTVNRRIRTLFPGIATLGQQTYLTPEQADAVRALYAPKPEPAETPIDPHEGMLTLKELASELGVYLNTLNQWVQRIFPDTPSHRGRKHWFSAEQVEKIKEWRRCKKANRKKVNRAQINAAVKERLQLPTVKDLAEKLNVSENCVLKRFHKLFPNITGYRNPIYFSEEQAQTIETSFLSAKPAETKPAEPALPAKPAETKPREKTAPEKPEPSAEEIGIGEPSAEALKRIQTEERQRKIGKLRQVMAKRRGITF